MRVIERSFRAPADPGRLVEDTFLRVKDDEPLPADGDVLVSLERFEAEEIDKEARSGRIAILAPGDTSAERLAALADAVDEIALELPKFTDGRAYSTARLLRDRHGFAGRLRATGQVLHDQLLYLSRCGFDVFELAPGKDPEKALPAFQALSVRYQAAADEPRPLWRRVEGSR